MDNTFSLNADQIPLELKVILDIVKGEKEESLENLKLKGSSHINWNLFLELAFHHRLYPLLYPKLKRIESKLIPPFVLQSLQREYKKNTFQMLHLSREMELISKLFEQNQIHLLVLKGPVLAMDLYGDLSFRTCGDLDVLIPIKELGRVDVLLSKIGFVKDDYIETILNDWKWRHHHVTYFNSEKRIKIEVHWRLNPGPGREPSFTEMWERKRVSSHTCHPVYYLGKEDLFLFLISHGSRHGWSRLRWLVDIHQITNQEIDWINLIQILKRYHYLHLAGQALILTSNLLNTRLQGVVESLALGNRPRRLAQKAIFYIERMVNLHTIPVPVEVARYHKRHLFSLMSLQQKILFVLSFLYPYPEDAVTFPLPKTLYFLYFPLRPILWAWRKSMKHVSNIGGL